MTTHARSSEFEISVRLLQPFLKLLAEHPMVSPAALSRLRALNPEDRFPLSESYRVLSAAIALTGDEDLGLKAGRLYDCGSGGPLEYAIRSASSVKAAIEVAGRYMRLLNDALDFSVSVEGDRAVVRLDNRVASPRAVTDFQASAIQSSHLKPHLDSMPGLEWAFPHPQPADVTEYVKTFSTASLRFGAPYLGYSFDKEYLDAPRETGDCRLHALLRKHAERLSAKLPKRTNVAGAVRTIIQDELTATRPLASVVAERLGFSQRTLARRLEAEGTSFKELLDESRKRLALEYLTRPEFHLQELLLQLGFSELATFYRAFKRWTGETPRRYHSARRRELSFNAERPAVRYG